MNSVERDRRGRISEGYHYKKTSEIILSWTAQRQVEKPGMLMRDMTVEELLIHVHEKIGLSEDPNASNGPIDHLPREEREVVEMYIESPKKHGMMKKICDKTGMRYDQVRKIIHRYYEGKL